MSGLLDKRILIVDDNPLNLKLAQVVLEASGCTVRTAHDADNARQVLGEFFPDAILMDLQMPGTDGLELTRQLRQEPATCALPIIALTAFAMVGDAERSLAAGCDAYLSKPLDIAALRDTVARFLTTPQ